MTWKVELAPAAVRELRKLDPQIAARILRFLRTRVAVLENPRSIGQALRGPKFGELWKYRIGDWRLIASIEDEVLRVLVLRIGNRREIYRHR